MHEFHAVYKTVFLHNVMEQNAAIRIEFPNDDVITLQYVLYASIAVCVVRLAVCVALCVVRFYWRSTIYLAVLLAGG